MLEMYELSVPSDTASDDISNSESKSSIRTSVRVVVGGRLSITVRKVSWKRTACHNFRRCCFSNREALEAMTEGSRLSPEACA